MDDPTTRRCARCGETKPLDLFPSNKAKPGGRGGYCKACKSAYDIARRAADPSVQRAWAADYRVRNGEKQRAWARDYYARNGDDIRAYLKEYRATHPGLRRTYYIRYYHANRAVMIKKSREWQRARPAWRAAVDRRYNARNPEKRKANATRHRRANMIRYRELASRRRARERAAMIEAIDYNAIYRRDKGICHICSNPVPLSRLHFDHVVPLSKGGAHSMENIKVSHARCNLRKGSKVTG